MPMTLVDPRDGERIVQIGDRTTNSVLGDCAVLKIAPPYEDTAHAYSFPGRVLVQNSAGANDWFYANEVGFVFIEVT